jgi:5-methylcytosine-specific restriction enzyme subunit McrC
MMAYAFQFPVKDEKRFLQSPNERFDHLEQLFAYMLNQSLDTIFKQGMHHEYIMNESFLRRPKGKMNITKTVSTPYRLKGEIYCEYDNFSLDNPFNQVIKKTLLNLLKSNQVEFNLRIKLKNKLMLLNEVQEISLLNYNWSKFNYNRNNRNYRLAIYVAKLLADRQIFDHEGSSSHLRSFLDSQEGHRLYERFIMNYYRVHYPELNAKATTIRWNSIEESQLLPIMKTDVFLDFEDHKTIIEAKFYRDVLSKTNYDSISKLRSHHLYQLYSYLDNYKGNDPISSVNGVLLYAITSETERMNEKLILSDHHLYVNTISLHREFSVIRNELDAILGLKFS